MTKQIFFGWGVSLVMLVSPSLWATDESVTPIKGLSSFSLKIVTEGGEDGFPPPPGAKQTKTFSFSYVTGGGFEEHFADLLIKDVKLVRSREAWHEIDLTVAVVDRTKSGQPDPGRALLFVDGSFTEDQIQKLAMTYLEENEPFAHIKEQDSIKFNIHWSGALFSISKD